MAIKDWTKQRKLDKRIMGEWYIGRTSELLEQFTKGDPEIYSAPFLTLSLVREVIHYKAKDMKSSKSFRVCLTDRWQRYISGENFKTKSEAQKYMKEFMRKN